MSYFDCVVLASLPNLFCNIVSPTVGHSEILREVDISASIYNIANDRTENTLQPYRCRYG